MELALCVAAPRLQQRKAKGGAEATRRRGPQLSACRCKVCCACACACACACVCCRACACARACGVRVPRERRLTVQLSLGSVWCTPGMPSHATHALACDSRAPRAQQSERTCDLCASGRSRCSRPPYTHRRHINTHTRCVPLCTVNAPPRMPVHDARPWFPRSPISPAPLPHWSHCVREVGTKTAIWHAAATLHPNSCLRPAPIAGRGGRVYKAMPPQPRAHLRFAFPSRRHVHRERGSR